MPNFSPLPKQEEIYPQDEDNPVLLQILSRQDFFKQSTDRVLRDLLNLFFKNNQLIHDMQRNPTPQHAHRPAAK